MAKRRRWLLVSALVVSTGGGFAYAYSTPFRLFVWVLAGRSPTCPLGLAVSSDARERDLTAAKDRILRASHLVRQDERLELWSTPYGEFWIPRGNRFVLPFNLAEMEQHLYGQGANFIRPGDVVLDCGASDGDFTREALKAGAKLVVAVEIAPDNIECLRRNLASEVAAGEVIVYPKGVWDRDDTLSLRISGENFAADSVVLHPPTASREIQVPVTTIDQLVRELGLVRVDFIKMDIEGAEVHALHGARTILTRDKPRLAIATEHLPDDEQTIPAAIRAIRSDYQIECGPCAAEGSRIRPEVLYFH